MGRPKLEPGTAGEMELAGLWLDASTGRWRTYSKGNPQPKRWESVQRWRARAYYRGHDGVRGEVSRQVEGGRRKVLVVDEAGEAIRDALAQRLSQHGGVDTEASTLLVDAGRQWLALIERPDSGMSPSTITAYRGAFERHIDATGSTVRGLTLEQVNRPPVLRRFLQHVADEHGTGSSKMARSVLAGIIGQAVDDGALPVNAIRSVKPVKAKDGQSRQRRATEEERDTERALTRDERDAILSHANDLVDAAAWERSRRKAQVSADLMHFLAGTGVRISEGLSMRWEQVDLSKRRAWIEGTKTKGSRRMLSLPVWLTERLAVRAEREGTEGLVFAAPNGDAETPWDRSNAQRALAVIFRGAGHGWATPHAYRRTVATTLHEAGVPIVKIADQLGHADPSMTMRVYLGRSWDTSDDDVAAHL